MSFDWSKYHDLACGLAGKDNEENWRSAISRAYYAVFNKLRIKAGYNTSRAFASHQTFIKNLIQTEDYIFDAFVDIEEDDLVYIGNQLEALRKDRNQADYDGTTSFDKRRAQNACDVVEDIFLLLVNGSE
jgi:uncharacterized protein (UPF0332 family)